MKLIIINMLWTVYQLTEEVASIKKNAAVVCQNFSWTAVRAKL